METSAIVMFIIGGLLLWGGVAVCIWRALRSSKPSSNDSRNRNPQSPDATQYH